VPRQTIVDHARMVTEQEETALVEYIKYMASRGFPLNRQRIRSYVI